jgi:hypothetical protein
MGVPGEYLGRDCAVKTQQASPDYFFLVPVFEGGRQRMTSWGEQRVKGGPRTCGTLSNLSTRVSDAARGAAWWG